MPISLSDYLGIDRKILESKKVFNTILDSDSRYFINFVRVRDAITSELSGSYETLQRFFGEIGLILKASRNYNDRFYREAYLRLNMHELKEICLGYAMKGTAGSGSGKRLKTTILSTAKEILDAGIEDPEIFQLVGLFEEGIGPDRISDMVGRIIMNDLENYSLRILSEIKDLIKTDIQMTERGFLLNPYNGKPLIMLPMELLHELPIAEEWEDIDYVCAVNRDVRDRINAVIGDEWRKITTQQKKNVLKRILLKEPSLFRKLIDDYKEFNLPEYDFARDPLGEAIWYSCAKDYATAFPLAFAVKRIDNQDTLIANVREICLQFKQLIEQNGLNEILYTDDGKPRRERISQKVFQGIADSYCEANNLDMSPEVNSGRGPVDFKFSIGRNLKVLVEVKLTTNPQLVHGYERQLIEYEKSERTEDSFYMVIDNGGSEKQLERLLAIHNDYLKRNIKMHELILIDGKPKKSASKYDK